jgi:hypothetical protein
MSQSISNLAAALVKFNAEVKRIEKDGNNPHFRSKYATLDGIEDEIRPLLQKHGLATLQFPGMEEDRVTVKTMLLHESGEWMESDVAKARPTKEDPQGVGSAITYLRRYSLTSMLSLSTGDVDDDGNAASQPPSQTQQQTRTATQTTTQGSNSGQTQTDVRKATEAQVKMINVKLKAASMDITHVNKFLNLNIDSMNDLPIAKVNDLIKYLDENRQPA